MKYALRSTLLALVAVFALGAVVASAASAAEPEFKPMPAKKKFTSTGGAVTFKEGGNTITCSSSTTSGEITGVSTIGKLVVTYKKCEAFLPKGKCSFHSPGRVAGEIVTNALKGELGTVSTKEAASGVGVLLLPETGQTWAMIESPCAEPESTPLTGRLAGEVTPIGKKQTSMNIVFSAPGGVQGIKEMTIAGKKAEVPSLKMYGTSATEEMTDALTFEEALEVT